MSVFPSIPFPLMLPEGYEARDHLLQISIKDGFCIATFEFGKIALPPELEPQLRDLVGKGCAILRLGGYHVREVVD